jgi:hypothetical protein
MLQVLVSFQVAGYNWFPITVTIRVGNQLEFVENYLYRNLFLDFIRKKRQR